MEIKKEQIDNGLNVISASNIAKVVSPISVESIITYAPTVKETYTRTNKDKNIISRIIINYKNNQPLTTEQRSKTMKKGSNVNPKYSFEKNE